VEFIPNGIVLFDDGGKILLANAAAGITIVPAIQDRSGSA